MRSVQHLLLRSSHHRSIHISPRFPGQGPHVVPWIPILPYPLQLPLGRKAGSDGWVFCCARLSAGRDFRPFIPVTGFIFWISPKSRNRPFEQIRRNQRHHVKVLFLAPCHLPVSGWPEWMVEGMMGLEPTIPVWRTGALPVMQHPLDSGKHTMKLLRLLSFVSVRQSCVRSLLTMTV